MIIFVTSIAVARFTFDFGFLQLMLVFVLGFGFTFAVGIIGSLLINKILFKNSKSERGKDG